MAARTYRTTEPMSTTQTLWTLRNLVLLILVAILAIVAMRWLGQMRIQNRVAIRDEPIVESVPAQLSTRPVFTRQTIVISTGIAEVPELQVSAVQVADVWIITIDGDYGSCPRRPVTYADLDQCKHIESFTEE